MSPEMIEKAQNIGGTIRFELYVTKEGTVKEAKILSGISDDVDADLVRAAKSLIGITPGKNNGAPINFVWGTLSLRFKK